MNRPRTALALLLLAASAPAWADWVKVLEGAERTYYLDPASVQRNATLSRVWTLMDLKKQSSSGALSSKALQEFDCEERRDRILSISEHSWPMAGGTTSQACCWRSMTWPCPCRTSTSRTCRRWRIPSNPATRGRTNPGSSAVCLGAKGEAGAGRLRLREARAGARTACVRRREADRARSA